MFHPNTILVSCEPTPYVNFAGINVAMMVYLVGYIFQRPTISTGQSRLRFHPLLYRLLLYITPAK